MQKFKVNTEVLAPALSKLQPAMRSKPVISSLSSIYVKVQEGKLELTASDLELTIIERIDCETNGDGFEALLPFSFLSSIVALNKKTDLVFEYNGKNGLSIISELDSYELQSLIPVSEYPKLQEAPKQKQATIDVQVLQSLKTAIETTKQNHPQLKFTYVALEIETGKQTVVSSDGGFSIYSQSFDASEASEDVKLLLPVKMINSIKDFGPAKISWNKKTISVISENSSVILTRCEHEFPEWRRVVPTNFDSNLYINRNHLIEALEKCALITDEQKQTDFILKNENLEPGDILLTSRDKGIGIDISAKIHGDYTGSVERITLSAEKLLKLAKQVRFDHIQLAIHDKNKAILIRSNENEGYLALLMPIVKP